MVPGEGRRCAFCLARELRGVSTGGQRGSGRFEMHRRCLWVTLPSLNAVYLQIYPPYAWYPNHAPQCSLLG